MQQFIIYIYFVVCILILFYTLSYIFFQTYSNRKQLKDVKKMKNIISQQIKLIQSNGYIERDHHHVLSKRLKKTNQLLIFDKALQKLEQEDVSFTHYLNQLETVVISLVDSYRHKTEMEQAYLAWFVAQYAKHGWKNSYIYQTLFFYKIDGNNIYLRENILTAVYQQPNIQWIVKAFHLLTKKGLFHHSKLIQDGLLTHPYDKEILAEKLWQQHEAFHPSIQEGIIGFITLVSNKYQGVFYEALKNDKIDLEKKTKLMRYFRRYPYEKVEPLLINYTTDKQDVFRVVSTQVLSAYPSDEVIDALIKALSDRNWYVRHNASQSLITLDISGKHIADILTGKDQYAKEMLSYHLHKEEGVYA